MQIHRLILRQACLLGLFLAPPLALADPATAYRTSYQLEARGEYTQALAQMTALRKSSGASYFLSLRTGWLEYLAGHYAAAESQYREAMAQKPTALEPKIGLSLVLYVAQKWKDLEPLCKQILATDPRHPLVRGRLAASYYGVGNYPDAAILYRKLLDDYPGDLDFQTGYAWALWSMGKRADARKLFQAVLAVSPDNASAREGVGME